MQEGIISVCSSEPWLGHVKFCVARTLPSLRGLLLGREGEGAEEVTHGPRGSHPRKEDSGSESGSRSGVLLSTGTLRSEASETVGRHSLTAFPDLGLHSPQAPLP